MTRADRQIERQLMKLNPAIRTKILRIGYWLTQDQKPGPKALRLEGKRFGILTVLARADKPQKNWRWLCECDCGKRLIVTGGNLRVQHSCGCLTHSILVASGRKRIKHGHATDVYGHTPEYRAWGDMIRRCTKPQVRSFRWYGAKGVCVADRWRDFRNFLFDMGERPLGTSLGRFLDSGDYRPGNCAWMTSKEQGAERVGKRAMIRAHLQKGDE